MSSNGSARRLITLEQFIIEKENQVAGATGEFSQLLRDIGLAARIVNREVNKAGLVDILGAHGSTNVQGESVQKLDIFANNQFIEALSVGGQVCVIGSEENDDILPVETPQSANAQYVVLMDPLDGSSNIDVNVSIGTIFSIYRRVSPVGSPGTLEDCLQPGRKMLAAGYVIYGSSTMLVYTTGNGVNGFTLDPSIGEFMLSHPEIRIPSKCGIYSTNEGNTTKYSDGVRAYLRHVKGEGETPIAKPYSSRYIGSMVADFHRNLLKGGLFLYPSMTDAPDGKLRLLYECNPMAFIAEQAGGAATNGKENILDLQPQKLHQRTPLYVGNSSEVALLHSFLEKYTVTTSQASR
jgi:fructose-1,6-bisphosphatase I